MIEEVDVEVEKGEVVCEDARYKMQTSIGVISKSQLPI